VKADSSCAASHLPEAKRLCTSHEEPLQVCSLPAGMLGLALAAVATGDLAAQGIVDALSSSSSSVSLVPAASVLIGSHQHAKRLKMSDDECWLLQPAVPAPPWPQPAPAAGRAAVPALPVPAAPPAGPATPTPVANALPAPSAPALPAPAPPAEPAPVITPLKALQRSAGSEEITPEKDSRSYGNNPMAYFNHFMDELRRVNCPPQVLALLTHHTLTGQFPLDKETQDSSASATLLGSAFGFG
jgi:hypothetical protein